MVAVRRTFSPAVAALLLTVCVALCGSAAAGKAAEDGCRAGVGECSACYSEAIAEAEVERLGWSSERLAALTAVLDEAGASAAVILTRGQPVFAYGDIASPLRTHSVRKSLMDGVLGVAVERGLIDLNMAVGQFDFEDRGELTEREAQATLAQLAQSRSGVYLPAASEIRAMREQKPPRGAHLPGEQFYYNNWDFNSLGAILERQTGKSIFVAFEQWIASPGGFCDYRPEHGWYRTEDDAGVPAFKFRLSARDLARFGQLYLDGGQLGGVRLLPEHWARSAGQTVSVASSRGTKSGYGRLWWTTRTIREDWPERLAVGSYTASGTGGQRLTVLPAIASVVVYRVDSEDRGATRIGTRQYDAILSKIFSARAE